jgi:hypothetical protein
MTGAVVASAAYGEGVPVRVVNKSGGPIFARGDGTSPNMTGSVSPIPDESMQIVGITHSSGTLRLIGAGSGYVYLSPMGLL